jgi:hypothetical protein
MHAGGSPIFELNIANFNLIALSASHGTALYCSLSQPFRCCSHCIPRARSSCQKLLETPQRPQQMLTWRPALLLLPLRRALLLRLKQGRRWRTCWHALVGGAHSCVVL